MATVLQKDVSLYEILDIRANTKLYFDIENIDYDEPNFIYNIIRDLKLFIKKSSISENYPSGIELTDYVLTINEESPNHEGLSYHLIFNHYYTTPINIRGLLFQFIKKYSIYEDYIDTVVYSRNRLFKSVYQIGIDGYPKNRHTIIEGTIEDSIIQNIYNCQEIKYKYEIPEDMKDYISRNHSWSDEDELKPKYRKIDLDDIKEIIKETIKEMKNSSNISENNIATANNEDSENEIDYGVLTKKRKIEEIKVDEVYGMAVGLKMKELNEKQKKYLDKLINDYSENKLKDYNLNIVKSILGKF